VLWELRRKVETMPCEVSDDDDGRRKGNGCEAWGAFACISWNGALELAVLFCLWRSAMMVLNALRGSWGALAWLLFTWCSIPS